MRLSAKARYALAAMTDMAQNAQEGCCITVVSIAERLGISKIYLEQVFSQLKKGGLVNSVKGAQGGYQLARMPKQITVYDILAEAEASLFEKNDTSVERKDPSIDAALFHSVYNILDETVEKVLKGVTLEDLVHETEKNKNGGSIMFYI